MPSTNFKILLVAFTVLVTGGRPALSQTPLQGSDITHPEQMSGIWESEDTQPTYGLDIELTTKVFGLPTTLAGVPQKITGVFFGVYEVKNFVSFAGRHFFSADSDGVQLTSRSMRVSQSKTDGEQTVALNLTFDPQGNQWSGKAHIDNFNGQITFGRPHTRSRTASAPLAGTWEHFSPVGICLHVAQQSDGSMAGWSDQLQVPGLIRYANGIKPPSETIEIYGVQDQVELVSPDAMLIHRDPYAAGGNLQTEIGKLTSDPNVMSAGAFKPWRRVAGDSCAANPSARPRIAKAQVNALAPVPHPRVQSNPR